MRHNALTPYFLDPEKGKTSLPLVLSNARQKMQWINAKELRFKNRENEREFSANDVWLQRLKKKNYTVFAF